MGRRSRRTLVSVGLALGMGIVSVTSAASASAAPTVAVWNLNEAPGATTAVDTSGNSQHGAIGSDIQTGVRYDGATAFRFPTWFSNAAGHEVVVPHSTRLEPGTSNFAVSVRLRTARFYSNFAQKGQALTPGGYWKVEVAQGRVTCHFTGGNGSQAAVRSLSRIDNGRWHSVRCGRTGGTVSLYIDGVKKGAQSGLSGSVANSWELAIGGKPRCDGDAKGCDFFAGDIDYVRIEKG